MNRENATIVLKFAAAAVAACTIGYVVSLVIARFLLVNLLDDRPVNERS